MPRALTALSLSTQSSRADGESSRPRSSVPLILAAVKPRAFLALLELSDGIYTFFGRTHAYSATSPGRSPPIYA